jgi:type 1 glutamine amidotransferase
MNRRALIVWGGWEGHEPQAVAQVLRQMLQQDGFDVTLADSLTALSDLGNLMSLDLIVPVWTMGQIGQQQLECACNAVRNGVGLAGCHGGMCDAFRDATEWHFMTGGQWVAHPGNDTIRYGVRIVDPDHPIMRGIRDFEVKTEQYYMHVDPANQVLADTGFPTADGPHVSNGAVRMPVIWTKLYGQGRVFYSSLGHSAAVVAAEPHLTILRRGFAWAARGSRQ